MTTVLVTGASGFIGSHLVEECLDRGWRVRALDALIPYYDPAVKRRNAHRLARHPACTYVEEELVEALPDILVGVDYVCHLAAQAGVRQSWGHEFDVYTHLNITTLQRLFEAAKSAPLKKIVFASSSSVYGDAEDLPTREDTILRPVSPYGATKAMGEHLAYLYWRSFGLPIVSVRYFTVYGPRQRPDMAFSRAIAAALDGDEFTLYGDGRQTRDFTFVSDAVAGTLAAAERGIPGRAYNLGGGSRVSMREVIEVIDELAGPLRVRYAERQRGDARDTAADISRAREELGFTPRHNLRAGLRAQLDWQRAAREAVTVA
ncbi:MAG: NAD-dependent epimerase/dehydratase family protein [Solirubrobacterales bacterium]|nr:NAD-dependent epimerase/dehydratase family protein [Solirubrobacterales bacterium]